jgi:hypothetical protein
MKKLLIGTAMFASLMMAAEKPTSVIHVVTVQWKPGTSDADIKKAIGGVEAAAKLYPGIKNVWLRSIKVQGQAIGKAEPGNTGATHAFVMEFESEKSLKDYANSPAQKAFYEVYLPHRGESRTHDITN